MSESRSVDYSSYSLLPSHSVCGLSLPICLCLSVIFKKWASGEFREGGRTPGSDIELRWHGQDLLHNRLEGREGQRCFAMLHVLRIKTSARQSILQVLIGHEGRVMGADHIPAAVGGSLEKLSWERADKRSLCNVDCQRPPLHWLCCFRPDPEILVDAGSSMLSLRQWPFSFLPG